MKKVEEQVQDWWKELTNNTIELLSDQNQYNCRNMLAGFLSACEKFELLTHNESQKLFMGLAK